MRLLGLLSGTNGTNKTTLDVLWGGVSRESTRARETAKIGTMAANPLFRELFRILLPPRR